VFRSILCPVDFSTPSRVALQHAVAIARRTGAQLTTMYADDPLLAAAAGHNEGLLTRQTQSAMRRLLSRIGVPVDQNPEAVRIVCAIGKPAQEILRSARRSAVDVIVMGTRGRRGAGRLFFGSVTEAVLRRTTLPVLAVSPGVKAPAMGTWPGDRIMCGVEFSPLARADVLAAARVAESFGTDLILVHVVSPETGPPWVARRQLRADDNAKLRSARETLEKLAAWIRRTANIRVESRGVLGEPAEELSATATDLRAGLIVLTLRRGHGLFGARQGSVTYRVLCGAAVPVLALRQAPSVRR
jgi:nucleotide-binding universal stress UspA family protein